ncbi:hypothetical protein Avbf_15404 [Armadillidium vulgare]|nr:hypothetical protein Avbf_15404 [Armadillidium vulgare]
MTNKLTDMIGLGDYRCDFETCTGVAYCFGLTREFQLNMSLCAEEVETTTKFVENSPNAEKMNVR